MKIITVIWLFFMTLLSHMPGEPSAEESMWLSRMTGVNESSLRRGMHVFLFAVLAALVVVGFPEVGLGLRIGAVCLWGLCDEATKIPIPGRHFSWKDVGLNEGGAIIGTLIGLGISAFI